ncbi:RNA 2',3'-cyclic phosphodiesterase [Actinopolymorpha singaporensis]|uniref:RNA 2',3'-cyclic phosphodiesterase n=1 Tax=Actinopolymorpha singaporensis TaxID=117157 RepID=A0A1H1LGU3_9ACTN|nr:RNA 2',3'-cyclic phosphodiesterase [Actinopolymorpha singaporensis]SDR73562.1 2'-5' RNA ligase [Actinopolymorpha singaporensis]
MRLFVAVVPPPAVLDDLAGEVARVRERLTSDGPDDNFRWSLREQWHLTLAFLGGVPDSARGDLHRRLGRAAGRCPPLRLRVAGGGGFGSARRARVLWAGIDGDLRPLRALAGSVSAAARRCGLDVREGRFRPHLTLARLREPADVRQVTATLAGYAGPEWVADRLELVASHLGQGEGRHSRYETVADWPLTGPSDPRTAEG